MLPLPSATAINTLIASLASCHDASHCSHLLYQTLNNVYLFDLHLRESPRRISPDIVEQLQRLIERHRARLQRHYDRSVRASEAAAAAAKKSGDSLFDLQQQQQFRVVYERQAVDATPPALLSSPSSVIVDTLSADERKDLESFCSGCLDETAQSSFSDWPSKYVRDFTTLSGSLSSLVCFISIDAGHGDDPRLSAVCRQIDPLWCVLIQRNLLPRWAATAGKQWGTRKGLWGGLVSSVLYFATHCIFAQTLYQTHRAKHVDEIVGYVAIAQLLANPAIIQKLKEWRHAELLAEIIAVSLSLACSSTRHSAPATCCCGCFCRHVAHARLVSVSLCGSRSFLLFCQVLQLDARHDAIVADIWQWLLEEWACKSVEEQLHNDLGPADPLHLIATFIMALPPVSAPADAAAVRLPSLSLGVDGAASETHMNPHQLKSKSKRLLSTQLGPPAKRLKSVDGCSDASTNLTLQPSVTGWPTRSLRSSAVRLLPSVRLDQLKATMLAHGCAHIEHAVSASLVSQIFREMQPWLD